MVRTNCDAYELELRLAQIAYVRVGKVMDSKGVILGEYIIIADRSSGE